jgi:hypothetical protein
MPDQPLFLQNLELCAIGVAGASISAFPPIGGDTVNLDGRTAGPRSGASSPGSSPPSNALPRLRSVALLSLRLGQSATFTISKRYRSLP